MNKIIISGNLTKEPETRVTTSGSNICNFTVAVTRIKRAGENTTDYFRVNTFGDLATNCQNNLHKGRRVNVSGSVFLSLYENKSTGQQEGAMMINASDVEFIDSPNR